MTQAQPEGPGASAARGKAILAPVDPTRRAGWLLILAGAVLLLILLLLLFL